MARRPSKREHTQAALKAHERAAVPGRARLALPVLAILILGCCAYLNADHDEFLFDSAGRKIESRQMRDLGHMTWGLFRRPLDPGSHLTYVTFALNAKLNQALGLPGFDVTTFLMGNVAVHALNAVLVFFLVRALVRRIKPARPAPVWIALVPALWFAVHPMHASSVAYIMQRRGAMAATFWLLGVLAYLRMRDDGHNTVPAEEKTTRSRGRIGWGLALASCYWLGCKSKPVCIPLPVALLMIEFCLRATDRHALRRYLAWMVAGLAVMMALILGFLWSRGLLDPTSVRLGRGPGVVAWGAWEHFLTESRVFVHYWKLLILPLPRWSCIDHDIPISHSLGEHYAFATIALHAILLALTVRAARQGYTLAAIGVFWFYIALIPYAVLPQTELFVEYKTYLPSIGLALVVAEILLRIRRRVPLAWQAPVVSVIVAALMMTTVRRNVIYQSPVNLWADAVAKGPGNARAHNGLGMAFSAAGRYDEAVNALSEALRLAPHNHKAHTNLGITYKNLGRLDEAIFHYTQALSIQPDDAETRTNLGVALKQKGDLDGAVDQYREALRVDPDLPEAHINLGTALYLQRRYDEAMGAFEAGLRLQPDHAMAHNNLAAALFALERYADAEHHARRALALRPDLSLAHLNLGKALAAQGRTREAAAALEQALRLNPNLAEARRQLEALNSPDPERETSRPPSQERRPL
jgi:tetratricopeptide (TPR) repeat protein